MISNYTSHSEEDRLRVPNNPLLRELQPGETIIWQGKPEVWPFVTLGPVNLLFSIPFSVLYAGFFIFLAIRVVQAKSVMGALFFSPFVLFSLYLLFGRFWIGFRCWQNTFYVLTSKRALIQLGAFKPRITSLELAKIPAVTFQVKRSGLGHVNFGKLPVYNSIYAWQPGPSWGISKGLIVSVPSFRYIREPEKTYEIICSLLESSERKS